MENRIDYWLVQQGMTYRHIAERAGISAQYVSMLAKRQRGNPSVPTMRKISTALGKRLNKYSAVAGENPAMRWRPGDRQTKARHRAGGGLEVRPRDAKGAN